MTKDDVEKILNSKYFRSRNAIYNAYPGSYTINDDLTVDVKDDVDIENLGISKLEVKFGIVEGHFDCSINQLTSLEGCPRVVGGFFDCSSNKLTSLKGCPKEVGGYFECSSNQLISLEDCPSSTAKDYYDFYCGNNPDLWQWIVKNNYNLDIIKFISCGHSNNKKWEEFLNNCPPMVRNGIIHTMKRNGNTPKKASWEVPTTPLPESVGTAEGVKWSGMVFRKGSDNGTFGTFYRTTSSSKYTVEPTKERGYSPREVSFSNALLVNVSDSDASIDVPAEALFRKYATKQEIKNLDKAINNGDSAREIVDPWAADYLTEKGYDAALYSYNGDVYEIQRPNASARTLLSRITHRTT